jgi:predicted esterase
MTVTRTIETATHGRYLVAQSSQSGPAPLLVGFHGYAEGAEAELDRLRTIPGADRWLLVAVQGLHRFYRGRSQDVVASWMTSQDRELAIADNLTFVDAVIESVSNEWRVTDTLVFTGFSQGVAMAFRAACLSPRRVSGVIALGGDVPPELDRQRLARVPAALVGRGDRDEWYTAAKWEADAIRLRAAGVDLRACGFAAGHQWTPAFSAAAALFLQRLVS